MPRARLLLTATVVIMAFGATPAFAVSATLVNTPSPSGGPNQVTFTGTAAVDHVTVSASGTSLVVADTDATITVTGAPGCAGSGTNTVTCAGLGPVEASLKGFVLGGGNDVFTGNLPSDNYAFVDGGTGDDQLNGGAEYDDLLGGLGADTIDGGAGEDTVSYNAAPSGVTLTLDAGVGNDGTAGEHDTVMNVEEVAGSNYADDVTGTNANETFDLSYGADTLHAGGGQDTVYDGGDETFFGPTGQENSDDTIDLGPGDDSLRSLGVGDDKITGGDGGDSITLDGGADTVDLGADNDTVTATGPESDVFVAGAGDDEVVAGPSSNTVDLGAGNDTFSVVPVDADATHVDVVTAGDGNDSVTTGPGDDTITGGGGTDFLDAGAGADDLLGGDGDDALNAGSGDNILDGGAGNDGLDAGTGNDTLIGGSGTDSLSGGEGSDILKAADGERDSLSCAGGSDTVTADPIDAVAADCETIGGGATPLGGQGTTAGSPGSAGAAGVPGRAGAPGASAPPAAFVLVAVDSKLAGRRGHKVTLRYVSTLAGAATLLIKKGSKTVATVRGTTKSGVNTVSWNGKTGRKKAAKGAYKVTLIVVSVDGRQQSVRARLSER